VKGAFWSPENPDIVVPTAFGVGWTVNVSALRSRSVVTNIIASARRRMSACARRASYRTPRLPRATQRQGVDGRGLATRDAGGHGERECAHGPPSRGERPLPGRSPLERGCGRSLVPATLSTVWRRARCAYIVGEKPSLQAPAQDQQARKLARREGKRSERVRRAAKRIGRIVISCAVSGDTG